MKVLVVNTVRFRMNGITSVIMNYYRKMDKSDMMIDFVVINPISKQYKEEFKDNDSSVFYINRHSNPVIYALRLFSILKKNRYDIIHIHGNSSLMILETMIAKIAKVPIRIVHSHNTMCIHKKLHKVLQPIFLLCYTNGFACSKEAGKWLFLNKQFKIIKNGIILDLYRFDNNIRTDYRKKLNCGDEILIGHVGNFIEQKNHEFLLDVFAQIQKKGNYKLLLISDGELLKTMKEKAKKLNISDKVIFLGKSDEVSKYMQAMDIFWLPSLYEGFPVVLVEAQAAGLPCLVSETVSKDVNLTGSIQFIPISNIELWVENTMKLDKTKDFNIRRNNSIDWCRMIAEKGYDVSGNAGYMKKLYKKYIDMEQG